METEHRITMAKGQAEDVTGFKQTVLALLWR